VINLTPRPPLRRRGGRGGNAIKLRADAPAQAKTDVPSPLRGEGQGEGKSPDSRTPLTPALSPEGRGSFLT